MARADKGDLLPVVVAEADEDLEVAVLPDGRAEFRNIKVCSRGLRSAPGAVPRFLSRSPLSSCVHAMLCRRAGCRCRRV